jgi:aminopeptidase N
VVLNGADVTDHHLHREGRLELTNLARENTLVVEAEFAYTETGTGLYRFGGGENASGCVYSNANLGGAARIFSCFDQPDLRAPITLAVRAPAGWRCRANYPTVTRPADGGEGLWRFTPTPPLAPYQFAFCASPEPVAILGSVVDRDPPVMLTIWTLAASGDPLDADMFTELVRGPLRYYADALGVPYPYPKCDLVFVPRFPGLAFSPPGLATLQDKLLKPSENRPALYLGCVLAHELAHAWFGGLLDLRHEDDMWLQEALATYTSRTALEETQPGSTPWASHLSVPTRPRLRQERCAAPATRRANRPTSPDERPGRADAPLPPRHHQQGSPRPVVVAEQRTGPPFMGRDPHPRATTGGEPSSGGLMQTVGRDNTSRLDERALARLETFGTASTSGLELPMRRR